MSYKLFTEYRYAGRQAPYAVIVPTENRGDEVLVTYKSAGARRKLMEADCVNELIEQSLLDDVYVSLVEERQLNSDLCKKMDAKLEEAGGEMSRTEWQETLAEARDELDLQK